MSEFSSNLGAEPHPTFVGPLRPRNRHLHRSGGHRVQREPGCGLRLQATLHGSVHREPRARDRQGHRPVPQLRVQTRPEHPRLAGRPGPIRGRNDRGRHRRGRHGPKRLLSSPVDSFFEISNPPQMKTDTHAFTAEVKKAMSRGWQARVSYTYLNSKGLLPSGRGGLTDNFGGSQAASLRFSDFGPEPKRFRQRRRPAPRRSAAHCEESDRRGTTPRFPGRGQLPCSRAAGPGSASAMSSTWRITSASPTPPICSSRSAATGACLRGTPWT